MDITRARLISFAVGVIVVLIILANTFFVVDQTSQAVVLRLGEPVGTINSPRNPDPGLKIKIPFLEQVVRLDKRNLSLETEGEEIIAQNQARLVVDAFVRYRISQPLQYYRAFNGSEPTATAQLERLVNSAVREALGRATDGDIIAVRRSQLTDAIRYDIAKRAVASRYGVEILDLRLRRVDLPETIRDAVYESMRTKRIQEAEQIRTDGQQKAAAIRAQARKEAETLRGEADSDRASIFASSFGKDPSFARFYRSMQAYEQSMANGETTLVLSPDSEFFRYFSQGPGK